ncbi:hypothetical protein [Corynebacterium bovis]|uniref:hypothetical protein n=1 Tax=Corynebacterium bovis TaxID=36808 RepID=UPI003138B7A0
MPVPESDQSRPPERDGQHDYSASADGPARRRRRGDRPVHCLWCGRPITDNPTGRPRRYCRRSCRQRAYEQRKAVDGTAVPTDALILPRSAVTALDDHLFELRCAAEDVRTAVTEGEEADGLLELCDELLGILGLVEEARGRRRE